MAWIAQLALAAYGAYEGKKSADKANDRAQNLFDLQRDQYEWWKPYRQRFMDQASRGLRDAFGYWQPLLSGSRAEAATALQPDIQNINQNYQNQLRNMTELGPRSGAGANNMLNLQFNRLQDINNAFSQGRRMAAQYIQGLAGQAGQMGSGAGSQMQGALGGQQNLLNHMLLLSQQQQQAGQGAGQAFAQGLGGFADWWQNRNPSGGGTGSDLSFFGSGIGNDGSQSAFGISPISAGSPLASVTGQSNLWIDPSYSQQGQPGFFGSGMPGGGTGGQVFGMGMGMGTGGQSAFKSSPFGFGQPSNGPSQAPWAGTNWWGR